VEAFQLFQQYHLLVVAVEEWQIAYLQDRVIQVDQVVVEVKLEEVLVIKVQVEQEIHLL
tara:strand:- start:358 stop:534 length:177 start_codon:yes stop_codon:yes gene_type:complete